MTTTEKPAVDTFSEIVMDDKTSHSEKQTQLESQPEFTAEQRAMERRLVRKLDMTLMPVVWTLYLFNYLDRNNIA